MTVFTDNKNTDNDRLDIREFLQDFGCIRQMTSSTVLQLLSFRRVVVATIRASGTTVIDVHGRNVD